MTIQYASDLHLEFKENEYWIRNNPLIPKADILVLAGDIMPFARIAEFAWFFEELSEKFKTVYWLAGNHEYYHYNFANKRGSFYETICENVFVVNDFSVTIENVRLILSTLWTTVRPRNKIAIERGMNDFHLIRNNGDRLTTDDLEEEYKVSLAFIEHELLQESGLKKVVATHHVPTFINYPEQYKFDVLNEAFAVELKALIRECGPEYWIYGHHHQSISEFQIGKTKLVTNQLGYVIYNENAAFDAGRVLML